MLTAAFVKESEPTARVWSDVWFNETEESAVNDAVPTSMEVNCSASTHELLQTDEPMDHTALSCAT